ncbi:MAG: glucosyltransferase domain-containing protein [Erysipelotrichaceae bacterium]
MNKFIQLSVPNIKNNIMVEIRNLYCKYNKIFYITVVIGFLAHGFAFSNKLLNWDDAASLGLLSNALTTGRWGTFILQRAIPDLSFSMPWIYGILTIVLITLGSILIIDMFHIKKTYLQLILAAYIIVMPAMTSTFSYMFVSIFYGLSIFFSILSVYIIRKKRCLFNFVFSSILLVLSLSIYQLYIGFAVSLFLLLLIDDLLHGDRFKLVFNKGVTYVFILLVSAIVYALINHLILEYYHITLGSYQGFDNISSINIHNIKLGIKQSYYCIYETLFTKNKGVSNSSFLHCAHLYVFLYVFMLLFLRIKTKTILFFNKFLIIILLLMLPLAINYVLIINYNVFFHTLMTFNYAALFILAIILSNDQFQIVEYIKYFKKAFVIFMCLIICNNIFVSNKAYFKMFLAYEGSFSFYTSLITQIKSNEEYTDNSTIAILGKYQGNDVVDLENEFSSISNITGIANTQELVQYYCRNAYLKHYIGVGNMMANTEQENWIKGSKEFIEMPTYPLNGSIRELNGFIVVKLGTEY